jgi:hypothetical protein
MPRRKFFPSPHGIERAPGVPHCKKACPLGRMLANNLAYLMGEQKKLDQRKTAWEKFRGPLFGLAIFGFVVTLWLGWAFYGAAFFARQLGASGKDDVIPTLGQVGDIFGGINALFAAFAFAGVAVAAYFQYRSLQMAIEQRKEDGEALSLMKQQHAQQAFEPLFFKLLERHQFPLNLFGFGEINCHGEAVYGRFRTSELASAARAFSVTFNEYFDNPSFDKKEFETKIHHFSGLYERNENELGTYYVWLFELFSLIDSSTIDSPQKARYANIVRAALSTDELFFMMAFFAAGRIQFMRIPIEKYGLLKNVPCGSPAPNVYERFTSFFGPTTRLGYGDREAHWFNHPGDAPPPLSLD